MRFYYNINDTLNSETFVIEAEDFGQVCEILEEKYPYNIFPNNTFHICTDEAFEALEDIMSEWQPIKSAPIEKDLLVGKWVNDEWRICKSGRYYDSGNYLENESSYWFWSDDWDKGGVTDDDGPSHWIHIPTPPLQENFLDSPEKFSVF